MRTKCLTGVVLGLWCVLPGNAQSGDAGCTSGVATGGFACTELGRQIAAMVLEPAVMRAHWGVMVTAMDGTPIYGLNEGQFFQPASNTKLFTTAAAVALLGTSRRFETRAVGVGSFSKDGRRLAGDLVLLGDGDANLSGRELPYVAPALRPKRPTGADALVEPDPLRPLAEMADRVAATGLRAVTGDVIGDDTLWPWEPYPADWSIDDAVWGYGAPVSALTVQDNQMRLTVRPTREGQPASVELWQGVGYYTVKAEVMTAAAKMTGSGVQVERAPGSRVLRVYGEIAADAGEDVEEVAIDDPAEYAASALKSLLEARGVVVEGRAVARHALPSSGAGFTSVARKPLPELVADANGGYAPMSYARSVPAETCAGCVEPRVLATRTSVDLLTDVTLTNKVSQNLHAEMLLHHLANAYGGLGEGNGSGAQGARVVRQFLVNAGLDTDDFIFYDGSGLSGHDLVTPRATAKLLRYASSQPWFEAWRATLPVGGEDGTLASRFPKLPLKDHLFAKTGTLGEARALSGYLQCASGRTVVFSVMVTDHAPGGHADQEVMDRIVTAIAAAN